MHEGRGGGGHLQADQHGPEDLLQVALHVGLDAGDDGGAHEVAGLVPRHAHAPTVQHHLGTLRMQDGVSARWHYGNITSRQVWQQQKSMRV